MLGTATALFEKADDKNGALVLNTDEAAGIGLSLGNADAHVNTV